MKILNWKLRQEDQNDQDQQQNDDGDAHQPEPLE